MYSYLDNMNQINSCFNIQDLGILHAEKYMYIMNPFLYFIIGSIRKRFILKDPVISKKFSKTTTSYELLLKTLRF